MEAFTYDLQSITLSPYQAVMGEALEASYMGLFPPLLLSSLPGMMVSKGLFFIQGNLLASGASDSEIFIWDLNNLSVPMTPGSKSQVRRLWGCCLQCAADSPREKS